MAPTTTDIAVFIVWLSWTCLSTTPTGLKNGGFATILPTLQALEQVLLDSSLTFAPGLLEVLQSKTPPSIAYFERLPVQTATLWGVYIIVLEKPGHRPKLYTGCGTGRQGVRHRLASYPKGQMLPKYVQYALDDGYTITHMRLLCCSPIPTASKRVPLRALYLVIEAAFSLYFWTMVSRTKDYGIPRLCPWSLDTREYDGCCSHVSLYECIQGADEVLTPEQLDAIEAARKLRSSRRDSAVRGKERTALSAKKKRDNNLATKKYSCHLCNVVFGAGNQLENHKRLQKHIDRAAGITKVAKNIRAKERNAANLAARRFYCSDCDYVASTQQRLSEHVKRPKHLKQVAESN